MDRLKLKSILIVICLITYGYSDTIKLDSLAQKSKSDSLDGNISFYYRIGWPESGGEAKGISLFETCLTNTQYHVFSMQGTEIFTSSNLTKQYPEGCGTEPTPRISWYLEPDTIYNRTYLDSIDYYSNCLVIGTKDKKTFIPPEIGKISDHDKAQCIKALKVMDSALISSIKFYSAGVKGNKSRMLIVIPPDSKNRVTITIIDIVNNSCSILYKKESDAYEITPQFVGQADLNEDGFCESFALNLGDYDGKWLLIFKKGKWIMRPDKYQPSPC